MRPKTRIIQNVADDNKRQPDHNTKNTTRIPCNARQRETNEQGQGQALAKGCKDTDGVRRGTFTQETWVREDRVGCGLNRRTSSRRSPRTCWHIILALCVDGVTLSVHSWFFLLRSLKEPLQHRHSTVLYRKLCDGTSRHWRGKKSRHWRGKKVSTDFAAA